MIRPASYLPSSTCGMIWSNGTTSVSMPGANNCNARKAVVSLPGTAMRLFLISAAIHDAVHARLVVGQLAFVNDQAGLVLAFEHLRDDLVERDDLGLDAGSKQLQRQKGRGELARNSDALGFDFCRGVC